MKYNKLVSVVMPVHNGEKFLKEAIESILQQTYTNFELLIIENCSTDNSLEIIKSYIDPRIRLIVEENCGQVQAYNRGFKEAKGEYIFIHDQDDISSERRFELQLECMRNNDIDICGSYIKLIDEKGNVKSFHRKSCSNTQLQSEVIYKTTAIHNSSVCIRKKVFKEIGVWNREKFPVADCDFYIRAAIHDFCFQNLDKYLYMYRRHSDQITAKDLKKSLLKFREISLSYLDEMNFNKKDVFMIKALLLYYTNNLPLAFLYFCKAFFFGERTKKLLRYILIILIFGLPLSFIRSTKYIDGDFFRRIVNFYNKSFI